MRMFWWTVAAANLAAADQLPHGNPRAMTIICAVLAVAFALKPAAPGGER